MEGDDILDINICLTGVASNTAEANLALYLCKHSLSIHLPRIRHEEAVYMYPIGPEKRAKFASTTRILGKCILSECLHR
jgi:hypothetical protein